MADRVILHCDLNNFFASVECVLFPDLKGKAIAVCGNPELRHGIVLAKNEKAKKYGVKTAEALWQAKQKCPELVFVPPHYDAYASYSRLVRSIYARYTDRIESFGLDECWLDVTSSPFGSGKEIADRLRKEVKEETGLTISVGVSFNKAYAKLGSDYKKPDATTVIDRSNYRSIVYPLHVDEMLMVGKKTSQQLQRLSISTLGDLAQADETLLKQKFGINGPKLKRMAAGEDDSPVMKQDETHEVKSVGHGTTTVCDVTTVPDAQTVISHLCEMIATRLRRYGLQAKGLSLHLRYCDLTSISRQCTLSAASASATDLQQAAYRLLASHWDPQKDLPLRTITVNAEKLEPIGSAVQQSFLEPSENKNLQLETAVDEIRQKYGFDVIKRANLLHNGNLVEKHAEEDDLLPFRRGQ